jgi:hypothetical protein
MSENVLCVTALKCILKNCIVRVKDATKVDCYLVGDKKRYTQFSTLKRRTDSGCCCGRPGIMLPIGY